MPPVESGSQNRIATLDTNAKISKEDQAELRALDAAVHRVRSNVAADPYILTIPQDVEPRYHHNHQYQAMQWLHNAPFRYSEGEWMQYQTFFYHEHGKEMYVLHSSGPKAERDGAAARAKAGTGANTPSVAPKKKITLDAYKKKQAGATPLPAVKADNARESAHPKQSAVKGPVERIKAETEEVLAAANEAEVVAEGALEHEEKRELKRKRDVQQDVKQQMPPLDVPASPQEDGDERGQKKARTASPSLITREPEVTTTKLDMPKDTPKQVATPEAEEVESSLPMKLSPLAVPLLPSRLSPTVPVNMLETLKSRVRLQPPLADKAATTSASNNGKLTPIRKIETVVKRLSPVPRNGFRANSSSPSLQSDADDRRRPITSAPQRVPTPDLAPENQAVVAQALREVMAKAPSKPSLMVKLKYKKLQRDSIKRILKMRPQPDPIPTARFSKPAEVPEAELSASKTARDKRDVNARGVAQKIGPVSNVSVKVNGDKHPSLPEERTVPAAAETSEPPAKKQKRIPEPISIRRDAISQPELRTPALQTPALPTSAQKSQQATPGFRKEHLSVAMQRDVSTDSHKINTPALPSGTPTTATQPLQSNGIHRVPASQPVARTAQQLAWENEQKRLETIGRELKHAATAHLMSVKVQSESAEPSNEQRLAAIKSLESLIAYLLAFASADEAALAADPKQNPPTKTWRSLHSYFSFVKSNCEPFPALVGIACLLGVVFNARILDITAQYPAEGPSRDTLIETWSMLQRAALDAETILDLDQFQRAFPKVWSGRAKGAVDPAGKSTLGDSAGDYKLPIGVHTPPAQAARAACVMLTEWIESEGVEYQLRVALQ